MTGRGDNPKHMFLSLFLNLLVEGVAKTPDIHATKPEKMRNTDKQIKK